MKSEQAIEKYLCRRIKENGGMCIKLVGMNGIPDRLAILPNGKTWFIEMKTDGGVVAPIQLALHMRLRRMGQNVAVLWNYEQVDKFRGLIFAIKITEGITC